MTRPIPVLDELIENLERQLALLRKERRVARIVVANERIPTKVARSRAAEETWKCPEVREARVQGMKRHWANCRGKLRRVQADPFEKALFG